MSDEQVSGYEEYAVRSNQKILNYTPNYILASIPVFISFGILTWLCVIGANATEKCFSVSSADDKPAIQRTLLGNYTVIGVAIGIALSSLISSSIIGPFTKIFIGILLIGVTSVAINSYMLLGDECNEDKIIGQKKTMYTILGVAIGLVFNGIVMSFVMYLPTAHQWYMWAFIFSIGMIVIGTTNIIADGKCNKDGLSSDEKESVKRSKIASIVEIVVGSMMIMLIIFGVYSGVGLGLGAQVVPSEGDYDVE